MDKFSRSIDDYPDGIVLPVDKPYRWTSADVIRKVKYAAIRHFGKKNLKVGHAGTLDPLATGILLVCIGNATKRAEELQSHDKEYVAGIRFGATTPSYDLEKEVDRRFPYEHVTREAVEAVLPSFLGVQEQVAPLFSAKSVDGVRAYEMARRMYRKVQRGESAGEDFDAAALETLRCAKIEISALELLSFSACAATPGGPVSERGSLLKPVAARGLMNGRGPESEETMDDSSLSDDGPEIPGGTWVSGETPSPKVGDTGTASSRIHVADTADLQGLPLARIRIACSKGTYIRAFARDLGEALGSGAHLDSLVRTRSGTYSIDNTLSLEEVLFLLSE